MWRNGRRNGLKIRSREGEVWVRIPSSAPSKMPFYEGKSTYFSESSIANGRARKRTESPSICQVFVKLISPGPSLCSLFAAVWLAVGMHCRGSIGRIYGHCGCSIGIVCVVLLFWWRQRGNDGSGKRGLRGIVWERIEDLLPVLAC